MMKTDRDGRRMRFLLVLAGGWACAALAVFAGPAVTASAHDYIVGTTPGDGETISVQPELISVTSSDTMIELGAALQVSGPAESPLYFGDGCVTVAGAVASMPAQLGAAGQYAVEWRVTSADGHPIDGTYTFDWAPDAGTAVAEGTATPPVCGEANPSGEETGEQSAAESEDAVTGTAAEGSELLWVLGGIAVLVVAGAAAWVFVRRLSAGPPSE